MHFVVHQLARIVLVGEAFVDVQLVFGYPPTKVSRHACVQRGVVLVGQYVNDSL